MPSYDLLLMDADNTLFDFDRSEAEALTAMFQSRGYAFDSAQTQLYHSINRPLWHAFDRGEITREFLAQERFRRFQMEVDGVVTHDPVKMNEDFQLQLSVRPYLLPGAEEVCRRLAAEYPIYIVTNGLVVAQRRITTSAIRDCFRDVFVSQAMGCQKPSRDYYDQVFASIGLTKADCGRVLLIGDNPISDILGGQNYGMDTVWYREHWSAPLPPEVHPTHTVDKLSQLIPLLCQIPH
jgi:2-haloacid dehalogenase